MGKRICVFAMSDEYDSVKLEPMRESDPALGYITGAAIPVDGGDLAT